MGVFEQLGGRYERVVFAHDEASGLNAIVAVFSTARGPALGGTRMWGYVSEDEALSDALRLAKAMAYKAAAANLALGGGKAVIIGNPITEKTPEKLRAYGRVVESMGGIYITTADVGTTVADLDTISEVTSFVTGTSRGSGDPSPVTAHGVWHGMRAVAERAFGEASLAGRHVVVQGTGKVGGALARMLAEEGARLTLADLRHDDARALADELGADVAHADEAASIPCDVFAPCALGPVVTDQTIDSFKCAAIAGAANNQLASPELARALSSAGILYAPDYVINAGGLINVEDELHGYDRARALRKTEAIADTLREVFAISERENITPSEAADHLAEQRIAAG